MALDSASRGPLLLGYPERVWPSQTRLLGPAYPLMARNDRSAGATEWPRTHPNLHPSPEESNSTHWTRRDHPRPAPMGIPERESQLPWQLPAYPRTDGKLDGVIVTSQTGSSSRQQYQHWFNKEQQSNDVIMTAEMRPRTSSWQRYAYDSKNCPPASVSESSWQRFAYETRNNHVDVIATSSSDTTASRQSPWHPSLQATDQASSDVMMTSYRERSQSMGSRRSLGANRAHSGNSLVSLGGSEGHTSGPAGVQRSEAPSEATYAELVNLWASSRRSDQRAWITNRRAPSFPEVARAPFEEACRRYSEASQRQHLRERLQQARQRYDDLPIDMTCRKKKTRGPAGSVYTASSTPLSLSSEVNVVSAEMSSDSTSSPLQMDSGMSVPMGLGIPELRRISPEVRLDPKSPDVGVDQRSETVSVEEESGEYTSILRSMLTERGRSYSMSVLELRRRRLQANRVGSTWPNAAAADDDDVNRSGTERTRLATISSTRTPSSNEKQLVTLAKKNLLPVTARITDLLGRIADFARSLPEFIRLSLTDQSSVLTSASLRLLVLYMAETNLQFATTIISAERISSNSPSEGPTAENGEGLAGSRTDHQRPREPTVQFVGCLQNFVRKCQTLNVTSEEYFQMKLITLFHSGVGSADCVRSSVRINSVARQDLQECVLRSHPTERLRYSTLLLSLHTLFGIHCDMLRALFCQHLNKTGGVQAFITEALATEPGEKKEVK